MKILFLSLLMFPGLLLADCVCTCVDGQNQALCESTIDLKPICPPKICPIEPPSIQPIAPIVLPPIGTKHCEMKQVLNPYTNMYEWQNICN